MDVRANRLGDLGPQILADGAAGDAAEHLAENEAEGGHVVALRCARLPPGFGTGQLLADEVPVDELLGGQPVARADDAGAVTHHHGQSDRLLAGLPELGPITGYRSIQVELTAVSELVHAGGRQALGAGQHRGEGVLPPGPRTGGIGRSAPDIHDQMAVDPYCDGRADLAAEFEIPRECIAHSDIAGCA